MLCILTWSSPYLPSVSSAGLSNCTNPLPIPALRQLDTLESCLTPRSFNTWFTAFLVIPLIFTNTYVSHNEHDSVIMAYEWIWCGPLSSEDHSESSISVAVSVGSSLEEVLGTIISSSRSVSTVACFTAPTETNEYITLRVQVP